MPARNGTCAAIGSPDGFAVYTVWIGGIVAIFAELGIFEVLDAILIT